MSFQELSGGGALQKRRSNTSKDGGRSRYSNEMPNKLRRDGDEGHVARVPRSRKSQTLVLHGRVQQRGDDQEDSDNDYEQRGQPSSQQTRGNNKGFTSSLTPVRLVLERKSMFSQLAREIQIFGRMVSDLEKMLAESGESPEAAWRARILIRSAQETDKELWDKLFHYEKSLQGSDNKGDSDLRKAQTACMKLHRDFKRVHKSLVLTLSQFETRQKAEISQLGAVGWSAPTESGVVSPTEMLDEDEFAEQQPEEDYFDRAIREREEFDRAMRTREIDGINQKMHTVNEIYNDLAHIVDDQQEVIDDLEEDVDSAHYHVHEQQRDPSLLDHFLCGGFDSTEDTTTVTRSSKNPMMKDDSNTYGGIDWAPLLACGDVGMAAESLRESYGIMRYHENNPIAREGHYRHTSHADDLSDDESPLAVEPIVHFRSNISPTARLRQLQREEQECVAPGDNLRVSEEFHWMMPFETLSEDVKAVHRDLVGWGHKIISPTYSGDKSNQSTF